MAFDIGLVTEFDDPQSIQDPIVAANAKAINLPSNVGVVWGAMRAPTFGLTGKTFQIYGRSKTDRTGAVGGTAWDASATTGLTITAALANVITTGSVIKAGSEIVIVKSVDRSANTIAVFSRGVGKTTAATHAAASAISVVGHAGNDTDLKNVESFSESTMKYTNYGQLIMETVDTAKTESLLGRKGLETDYLTLRRKEAQLRVSRMLANIAVNGVKQEGVDGGVPYMTAGLFAQLGDSACDNSKTRALNRYNAAGALSETVLKGALKQALSVGNPDTLIVNPSHKAIINEFGASIRQAGRDDRGAGWFVNQYDYEGKAFNILVDADVPSDRIAVVTLGMIQKGWLDGDMLRFEEEPKASSREMRESLQGTFGIIVDGVGYDHLDIYGIA